MNAAERTASARVSCEKSISILRFGLSPKAETPPLERPLSERPLSDGCVRESVFVFAEREERKTRASSGGADSKRPPETGVFRFSLRRPQLRFKRKSL